MTITLIVILVWNLTYSYRMINVFESENLAMEKAAGEVFLYTKSLEMAANMAAATGDLTWRKQHEEDQAELSQVLERIPTYIDSQEAANELLLMQRLLGSIGAIEDRSFHLIGRGYREEAFRLLSGWNYTKSQLELEESKDRLVGIMHTHVDKQLAFMNRTTTWLLLVVAVGLLVLVASWYTYYRIWWEETRKRQEKEERILYLSYHDALTGLYNRRYFEEEVNRLNVERKMPLTIILGDANNLKKINDSMGHYAGDQLLIEMARIMQNAVRQEDVVARWGGDEFGIILPNSDEENAQQIIKRIETGCNQSIFEGIHLSISLGYAIKTNLEEPIDQAFTRAENRMYKKKRQDKKKMRQQVIEKNRKSSRKS